MTKEWSWSPKEITKTILGAGLSPAEILAYAAQAVYSEAERTPFEKMRKKDKIFAGLIAPEYWGDAHETFDLRDKIAVAAGIRQELCYLEYPRNPNVSRDCAARYPDAFQEAMRVWWVGRKLKGLPYL